MTVGRIDGPSSAAVGWSRRAERTMRRLVLAVGVGTLAGLIGTIGPATLLADVARVGGAIVTVIALELVVDACNTLAWRCTLADSVRAGFWRLFFVRQAGTAVNQLTPTATFGGEAVKAALLRSYGVTAEIVASLVTARTSYAAAQAITVAVGTAIVVGPDAAGSPARASVLIGLAPIALGTVVLIALQRRGVFAPLATAIGRAGVPVATHASAGAQALDRRIAELYRNHRRALLASLGWHLAGQLTSVVQLLVILHALGVATSVATAVGIEAVALAVDAATFLVPGRIGVQEGGRIVAASIAGLPAATGLAIGVVVRLAQLATAALGLVSYACLSSTTASEPTSMSTT